ncbi:MAG: protein kinase [Dongiaceae bacterium]
MDVVKARLLEEQLRGAKISKWQVQSLINHGKSAAVLAGVDESGRPVAIKIFDDELILRYGDSVQLARIERELDLVGKNHPNLVGILGGGVDRLSGNHYIVMDYLDGPNLRDCLADVPKERVPEFVRQLAAAARFLEDLGLVHRDIKPENIVLTHELTKLVLLDLGVLRPIAGSSLTDGDGTLPFVGTLQYSSPEFLLRSEEDSAEGWRALTFYQIGGVLHDLIMRRPLFEEFSTPYARLVNAVQSATPEIQSADVPHYLVETARCCLLKDWRKRLRLVTWESFEIKADASDQHSSAKQRVTNRVVLAQAQIAEATGASAEDDRVKIVELQTEVLGYLKAAARTIRSENSLLPPLRIIADVPEKSGFAVQFAKSETSCLARDLTILIRVEIVDVNARAIALWTCACMGSFTSDDEHVKSHKQIFQGTYDATAVYLHLEACVYDFIDQAQQQAAVSGGNTTATWLYFRG